MDRLLPMVQGIMAFTDLFQVPLIIAVVYSFTLSRRWGRAWKGIGAAFAGYTAWVILTAFLVGFSPSGYVLLTLGTLLDPIDPLWKSSSNSRVWACGVAGTVIAFWAIPTGLAWLLRRRSKNGLPVAPRLRSWTFVATTGLLLFAVQQVLFSYAGRLRADAQQIGAPPIEDQSSLPWGIAAAATLPTLWLLATALVRWIRRHHSAVASTPN